MIQRIFIDHPASVGESYGEHLTHALYFSMSMLAASMACFIHALIPALFERTGSRIIRRLHDRMLMNRTRRSVPPGVNP